jgi:hypothetical protein
LKSWSVFLNKNKYLHLKFIATTMENKRSFVENSAEFEKPRATDKGCGICRGETEKCWCVEYITKSRGFMHTFSLIATLSNENILDLIKELDVAKPASQKLKAVAEGQCVLCSRKHPNCRCARFFHMYPSKSGQTRTKEIILEMASTFLDADDIKKYMLRLQQIVDDTEP